MTLSTLTSRTSYPGTGSAGPFAIPFRFLTNADLRVTKRTAAGVETTLTLTTHYTLTGAGEATGTLTLVSALLSGETLVIRRAPALTQPTSIRNQGAYFPATIEDEFDRIAMQLQALQDLIDRSPKLKETWPGSPALTELTPTSAKVIGGNGTGFEMLTISSGAVALPGGGRTVASLSEYLANNAVHNSWDYGIVGDSLADDRAALNTLVNVTLQPNGGRLDIAGVVRIGSNMTIPNNVPLRFLDGSSLAPDVGVTVTINSPTSAERLQIFGGLGTVLFGPLSGQEEAYPEWFGAKGDSDGLGGGTNDAPAFNRTFAAIAAAVKAAIPGGSAISSVGAVDLAATRYRFSSSLIPTAYIRGFIMRGKGGRGINIGQVATSLIFDVGVAGLQLLAPVGASAPNLAEAQHYPLLEGFELAAAGIRTGAVVKGFYAEIPFVFRNFSVRQFKGTGFHVKADYVATPATNANRFSASDGAVSLSGGSGVWVEGNDTNAGSFSNVLSGDNLEYGFRDDSKYGIQCFNCEAAANTLGGYNNAQLADPLFERQTTLIGCYDGDGPVISDLRHPAVVVGGTLAFQTKAATSTCDIWPPQQGPWTPTIILGTSGSVTYNATFTGGRWTRHGRTVILQGQIQLATVTAPLGVVTIGGLAAALTETGRPPQNLTPAANQKNYLAFVISGTGYAAAIVGGLDGRVLHGVITFEVNKQAAGGFVPLQGADLTAATNLIFTIVYTAVD